MHSRKSGSRYGLLIVILLIAVIAGLTVIGSMIWIGMDAAKPPVMIPDPGNASSEEIGSGETSSGNAGSSSAGETGSSGESSAAASEAVSSGNASSGTAEQPSEGSSGETSEIPVKPPVEGDRYIPFKPGEKVIAITFDDGPSYYTDIILDKIEGTGDKVTFFVVGNRISEVSNYESQLKRAVSLGCQIGNHTYEHKYLTKMSESDWREQLRKTSETVKKLTGAEVTIMRPPGGHYDSHISYGYANIMWAVDTEDWKKFGYIKKGTMTKDEVIAAVRDEIVNNVYSGGTVLLHDIYETSALAFCQAYDILKAQGWKFVTVSELLQIEGRETALKPYVFFSTRLVYLEGEKVIAE